jgi:tetratricopeptide (TPR) repeat protein
MRLLASAHGYVFYLYKMVAPTGLAPFYPYPVGEEFSALEYGGATIVFSALTLGVALLATRRKAIFAAWAYYLATLLPVIGIVQTGGQFAADRYTYLPALGPFLLIGLGVGVLCERGPRSARIATTMLVLVVTIMLSGLTARQLSVWKNSETLWTHELKLYPERRYSSLAYNSLGMVYKESGRKDEAAVMFKEALRLRPDYRKPRFNLAGLYLEQGRTEEGLSILEYDPTVGSDPLTDR